MKNKILLGSVTLLSALMVAACGNGEKKATETTAAPTTEATTATPTTTAQTTTAGASATQKKFLLKILNVSGLIILVISTCLKIGKRTTYLKYNIIHQTNTIL